MKLVLQRKDFVRCQILSKKISKRHMNEKGLEALKIKFYQYMTQYFLHEKLILDAAKANQTIFDTVNKAEAELKKELDPTGARSKQAFEDFVVLVMVSGYNNEKVELLHLLDKQYARDLENNNLLFRFV